MKPYKYLITNGCSFTQGATLQNSISSRFGKLIADKLGLSETNLAEPGGSNDRIFRTSFNWVNLNKDKCKDSLMIIGLTESYREEVYSRYTKKYVKYQYPNIDEPADIEQFKNRSGIKNYKDVKKYLEIRLFNFVDENYLKQTLDRNIILFDNYAKSHGLDVVYFDALLDYGDFYKQGDFLYEYTKEQMISKDKFIKENNLNYFKFPNNEKNWKKHMHNVDNSYDGNHPNEEQHQYFSEILWEYLNEKFK